MGYAGGSCDLLAHPMGGWHSAALPCCAATRRLHRHDQISWQWRRMGVRFGLWQKQISTAATPAKSLWCCPRPDMAPWTYQIYTNKIACTDRPIWAQAAAEDVSKSFLYLPLPVGLVPNWPAGCSRKMLGWHCCTPAGQPRIRLGG